MKAFTLTHYQKTGTDHVQWLASPEPQVQPGQLLIATRAAAVNPADLHIASGEMALFFPRKPPFTLGVDGAGVVQAVGAGVQGWSVGDEVFYYTGLARCGTMAEQVLIDADACARKPACWTFTQAAAGALALLCADLALARGGVASGQRILVHGGAGSVGAAAVWLAGLRGAQVHTTGSARDASYVRGLGAAQHFDQRGSEVDRQLGTYDMVLDGMGDAVFSRSVPLLRQGGTLVSLKVMTGVDDMRRAGFNVPFFIPWLLPLMFRKPLAQARRAGVLVQGVATYQDGATLGQLARLVETQAQAGQLFEPRIDRVFAMSQASQALEHFAHGQPRGKVVLSADQ